MTRRLRTSAPVNFVYETPFDRAALEAAPSFEYHAVHDTTFRELLSARGDISWTVVAYYKLREQGFEGMELSMQPRRGCINLVHSDQLRRAGADAHRFDVSVQSDYPFRVFAHFHLQQNAFLAGGNRVTLWVFPQAGIIPRSAPPGRMERIGYLGHVRNNMVWNQERWQSFLDPLGVEFVTAPAAQWHDFSDLDAVVAIRSFGKGNYYSKPPSKLTNAWIAGVPFIGGYDSAYRQAGTPGDDYLLATSPAEVADAIRRLRDEPGLAEQLVSNGRDRVHSFSEERLTQRWVETLEGPVEARYQRWQSRPAYEALRSRTLSRCDKLWVKARGTARRLRHTISR